MRLGVLSDMAELTTLPNGWRVLAHHREGLMSRVEFYFGNGGALERAVPGTRPGVAHFLEHMLFTGTLFRSESEITSMLSRYARFNAGTGYDHTSYHVDCMNEHAVMLAELLSEMITYPLFAADKIERERGVILTEFTSAQENFFDDTHRQLTKLAHGFDSILGTRESLTEMNRGDMLDWHRTYVSQNGFACVCGNAAVINAVTEVFSRLPALPDLTGAPVTLTRHMAPKPQHLIGAQRIIPHNTTVRQAMAGVVFPFYDNEGMLSHRFVEDVLDEYLTSFAGRIYQRVRTEMGLAYQVFSGPNGVQDNTYVIGAILSDQKDSMAVTGAILEEVEKLANGNIDQNLLDSAIDSNLLRLCAAHDTLRAVHSEAYRLSAFDRLVPHSEVSDMMRGTTSADLQEAAKLMLTAPSSIYSHA